MKLIQTSEFALRPVAMPHSEDMPKSELMLNGLPTGKIIDGAVLEAAIRWHDCLLAFVTDAITHEETLRVYLFNDCLNIIDSAQLGWMYATGVFSLLELQPPNTVRFLFFGDTDWTLELFGDEVFAIPFFTDPRGVSRPLRFHRRFQISGSPRPEPRQSGSSQLKKTKATTATGGTMRGLSGQAIQILCR
ncbi:hypothetical protein GTP38_21245 [Duganella sp. FT94W]|uniref:Uncharacterized protein n=1 Tax=Duganella lactea TaxID=2692173 RepID=A0ABW9VB66_9BURK|nr:hypothetical protein [Duganella lactea]MYM36859.1 hypothetical protein [Duganella lactea]